MEQLVGESIPVWTWNINSEPFKEDTELIIAETLELIGDLGVTEEMIEVSYPHTTNKKKVEVYCVLSILTSVQIHSVQDGVSCN